MVQQVCADIWSEQQTVFFQYRSLLTTAQWQLLKAIAVEGKLYQPGSKDFLLRHKLGSASAVNRGNVCLLSKEMIYQEVEDNSRYYTVYDTFLARWLARI